MEKRNRPGSLSVSLNLGPQTAAGTAEPSALVPGPALPGCCRRDIPRLYRVLATRTDAATRVNCLSMNCTKDTVLHTGALFRSVC